METAILSGTVTFLCTDIVGSTRLWEQFPEAMERALTAHDRLLQECIEAHQGVVLQAVGDSFRAAFARASDALQAAIHIQRSLQDSSELDIPLQVRLALFTGDVAAGGVHSGPAMNRALRLMEIGHGGQILLSGATRQLLQSQSPPGCVFHDKGDHRLRDLDQPEMVWQVVHTDLESEFPPLRSLQAFPNNLPLQLTSFIGRERELQDLKLRLAGARLLTLTGSGGVGKTRLALQAAAEMLDQFPEGAWFIELSEVRDHALIAQQIATMLGLRAPADSSYLEILSDHLKDRTSLLILDNCEHLVEGAAPVVSYLLTHCANLKIMVTSREVLRLPSEQVWRAPSLNAPTPLDKHIVDEKVLRDFENYDSVQLFMERARSHAPQLTLNLQNAPYVAQICAHLDGIPLAIELAAARIRALPLEQLVKRLNDRFKILTSSGKTAIPRQQTLRALIDWSYDLLNESERKLLYRLAIFRGGWTLEAAETVCSDPDGEEGGIESWEVIDLLTSLVDKSLVVADPREGSYRYRLLETVRQYALERKEAAGETTLMKQRHRDYFLQWSSEGSAELMGANQVEWLNRFAADIDNFRAALEWCLEEENSFDVGCQLAGNLDRLWMIRGYFVESLQWNKALLEKHRGEVTDNYIKSLQRVGNMYLTLGDFEVAKSYFQTCAEACEFAGNRRALAGALGSLGTVSQYQGDFQAARALFKQSLAINEETGNQLWTAVTYICLGSVAADLEENEEAITCVKRALVICEELNDLKLKAHCYNTLGVSHQNIGNYETARHYYTNYLDASRQLGDTYAVQNALVNMGNSLLKLDDETGALQCYRDCLANALELGTNNNNRNIATILDSIIAFLRHRALYEIAAQLLGAADHLHQVGGSSRRPLDQSNHDKEVALMQEALGEDRFERARIRGESLDMIASLELALTALKQIPV